MYEEDDYITCHGRGASTQRALYRALYFNKVDGPTRDYCYRPVEARVNSTMDIEEMGSSELSFKYRHARFDHLEARRRRRGMGSWGPISIVIHGHHPFIDRVKLLPQLPSIDNASFAGLLTSSSARIYNDHRFTTVLHCSFLHTDMQAPSSNSSQQLQKPQPSGGLLLLLLEAVCITPYYSIFLGIFLCCGLLVNSSLPIAAVWYAANLSPATAFLLPDSL